METPIPPCLYCKRDNGRFSSVEHVIPEGLGNHNIVLPKGIVCDECNNEKLSTLDKALTEFKPIAKLKTLFGVPSKTGALPKARLGNASLEMLATGNVRLDSNDPKAFQVKPVGDGTNQMRFTMQFDSHRPSAKECRKLTRALLKMLLGCICLDRGLDFALSERFDPMRDKILERTKFNGYFAMMSKVKNPASQDTFIYYKFIGNREGKESVWVIFQFYGIVMSTDSEMFLLKDLENLPQDKVGVFKC